jgi:hypothetical protein
MLLEAGEKGDGTRLAQKAGEKGEALLHEFGIM